MSENAAHLVVISFSTSLGGSYTEIGALTKADLSRDRVKLDITSFANTAAHVIKLMGLKDTKLSLGGNLDLSDTGQSAFRSRYDDGASVFVQIKWDGSGGSGAKGEFKVASVKDSASVAGIVETSFELEGTPNSAAGAIWT